MILGVPSLHEELEQMMVTLGLVTHQQSLKFKDIVSHLRLASFRAFVHKVLAVFVVGLLAQDCVGVLVQSSGDLGWVLSLDLRLT